MSLGIIINFITYRGSVGCPEKVGTLAGSEPAGAAGGAGPAAREPAGQYDQAFCTRRMQAEDMKNAKLFLQYGPLSAATIEKFDQWRDDIMRAAHSVNLTEQAHWATINRFTGTHMENNIYQTVVDLIPEGRHEIEALDPNNLLDKIEAILITHDQLEYKRLEFEVAKQEEDESLWQFENRLLYLQKQAKITDDGRFVETYKKGILNNKLRETLMVWEPPITTKAALKQVVASAQVGILQYARNFNNPPAAATASLGA